MIASKAFTLIEMIVVLAVMMTVMGMLLPGIATVQRKSDLYATSNVLQTVHAVQFRNARQFGSAGLVYGYTLDYSTVSGTMRSAGTIKPWIIGAASMYQNAVLNDLKSDIGKQMFWASTGDAIEFVDLVRPAGKVTIAGSDETPTSAKHYVNVGFSPRHGFVMAECSASGTPSFSMSAISDPEAVHTDVLLELWSTKSKRATQRAHITSTGIINVDGNL
jgi:hypothetical protein